MLYNPVRSFQLYGTQPWGVILDYNDYDLHAPAWRHYRIPVGEHYTGQMQYLFFISDDDAAPQDAQSYFRNVRVYEGSGQPGEPIDFTAYTFGTYIPSQDWGGGTVAVEDSVLRYEWDARNRLVAVREYASAETDPLPEALWTVEYRYDTQNRLIGRLFDPDGETGTADAEQGRYVWDGSQIVLEFEKTGSGDLTAADLSHRYLWGPAVDQILADERVDSLLTLGDILWPLTDHLGTVRDLATFDDQTQTTQVLNHLSYDAFGNVTSETAAAVDHLFAFTGRQLDPMTGLQNNLNRWYDPTTGRWLSEDPIGFEGGDANLMRYVGNRPVVALDPEGLQGGHHWVPQRVTAKLRYLLSYDAATLFMQTTRDPVAYAHSFDTWKGVTHAQYSDAVETLIRNYHKWPPKSRTLSKQRATRLLHWIETGQCGNKGFLEANQKAFKLVHTWRRGFLQSIAVVHAAKAANPKLTLRKDELKAIARKVVNGDESVKLSRNATKAMIGFRKGGKAGLKRAAGKAVPALFVVTTLLSARRGFAGEGHHHSGVTGAYLEVTRDLVLADMVEGVAFPAATGICDTIWEFLGLRGGADVVWRKRLNKVGYRDIDSD